MRSLTRSLRHARTTRRMVRPGAGIVLTLALAASAVAFVAAPAQAGVINIAHTCSGDIKEPATVSIDTDAPATMYVNETANLKASTSLNWPGKTTYNMMLAWGKGWVEGAGDFKVNVGATPKTFTTPFTRTNVTASWLADGAGSDPINLLSSGSNVVPITAPATPGTLNITQAPASSVVGRIRWKRNSYFQTFNDDATCVSGVAPLIDAITIRSRSQVVNFALSGTSVQQNTPVTASANVTVDGGSANGTLRYVNTTSGEDLATVPVTNGIAAAATLPSQAVGAHNIEARFVPTNATLYDASTAGPINLQVKPTRATTTGLTLSKTEIAPTGFSIATATVRPATGTGSPLGSVRFSYAGTTHDVALNPDGTANHTISDLVAGSYPVRAAFVSNDVNTWSSSDSTTMLLDVVKRAAVSTTLLTFTKNPALTTDAVEAVASVSVPGGATANGSVSFTISGGPNGIFDTPAPVAVGAGGKARLDLSYLDAGVYDVVAEFSPDDSTDQTVSASDTTPFTVVEAPPIPAVDTTTAMTLDKSSVFVGESVIASATVSQDSGPTTPTGVIVFTVDGVETTVPVVGGAASLVLPNLAAGSYSVTARFESGDPTLFNGSGPSLVRTVTVTKRPAVETETTLTVDRTSMTEDDAATAVAMITAPSGALTGEVDFEITVAGATTTRSKPYRASGSSILLADLAPGDYSVRATFRPTSPDDFTVSSSDVKTLSVTAAPASSTTTTLELSRIRATTTQTVTATATVASGRGEALGTVDFVFGSTTLTADVVNGSASVDLVGLAVGPNTVSAAFTPRADAVSRFLASTATPLSVTITQAPAAATVTSVSLSAVSTVANAPVIAQIFVAGAAGDPEGDVDVTFQGRTVRATLVEGAATVTVPAPPSGSYDVGNDEVVVTFDPAGPASAASAGRASLIVTPAVGAAPTSTVLSLSKSSISQGSSTTALARVTSSFATAAGSIHFVHRGVTTVVALSGGKATLEITAQDVGTSPVTASFVPTDGATAASSSGPVTLTVWALTAAPSATTLRLSSAQVAWSQPVTATATVSSTSGSRVGSVDFLFGDRTVSAPVDPVTGQATVTLADLAAGAHPVTASFVPEAPGALAGSTSSSRSLDVVATSAVNLSVSKASMVRGEAVSAMAAVTAAGGPAAGAVTFRVGGRDITVPVNAGAASATLPDLAPGNYAVVASFAPADPNMRAAVSDARTLSVTAAQVAGPAQIDLPGATPAAVTTGPTGPTSLSLMASRSAAAYRQPTTVVATAPAGVAGFVQFTLGGFSQDMPVINGTATLTVPRGLPVGSYQVNATLVPTDSASYTGATASTALTITKDISVLKFAKRWTPATKTLQVRARIAGKYLSPGTGKVTFQLLQPLKQATGKGKTKKTKFKKVATVKKTLDDNGVAEVKLPTKGKRGTFTVKVTYAGSTTLLPSTLAKNLKIR